MKIQRIAVGGRLVIDGKLLVIKRSNNDASSPGYWELPKGAVDFGEDLGTALKREFLEETNLRIEPVKFNKSYSHTYRRDGNDYHLTLVEYQVDLAKDEDTDSLKLSHEHDQWKFVDYHALKKLEPIYPDFKKQLLAELQ